MSTIQNSDQFQVQSGSTQYKTTANLFRDNTKTYDNLLVNRSGTNYKQSRLNRYNVDYSDKLYVNRSGVDYTVSGEDYFNYMWQYGQSIPTTGATSDPIAAGNDRFMTRINGSDDVKVFNYSGTLLTTITDPASYFIDYGAAVKISDQYSQLYVGATDYAQGGVSSGDDIGALYVYNMSGNFQQLLTAADPLDNAKFGYSVDANRDRLVVGSPGWGSFFGDGPYQSGGAYLYSRSGSTWNYITKMVASDRDEQWDLGQSVAISDDDKVFAGAPGYDGTSAGCGAVYTYNINGTGEQKIVNPDDGNANAVAALFGWSIDTADGLIVIGAPGTRSNSGNDTNVGAVYLYQTNGTYLGKMQAPTLTPKLYYGASVSIGSGRIIVGAHGKGDFGDPAIAPFGNGSVYVYDYNRNLKQTLRPSTSGSRYGYSVSMSNTGKFVVTAYLEANKSIYLYD